jgi:hypothetical protein
MVTMRYFLVLWCTSLYLYIMYIKTTKNHQCSAQFSGSIGACSDRCITALETCATLRAPIRWGFQWSFRRVWWLRNVMLQYCWIFNGKNMFRLFVLSVLCAKLRTCFRNRTYLWDCHQNKFNQYTILSMFDKTNLEFQMYTV